MNSRACCCRDGGECPKCKLACLYYCEAGYDPNPPPPNQLSLNEAWNKGHYFPDSGNTDQIPFDGEYNSFNIAIDPCNDPKFEYALIVCNINAARDDEFDVCLNGYELGPIPELGVDLCGGRFFATSQEIVDALKEGQTEEGCPQLAGVEMCCVDNTDAVTIVDKLPFMAGNLADGIPFFQLFMRNTKENNNGNFGEFAIWRMSKYKEGGKQKESICLLGKGNYAGGTGDDLGPYDFGHQPLCPSTYPAPRADECSEYYYPPPIVPEPLPRTCKGECIYTWSESEFKWILDALSFCCKSTEVFGDDCDIYDPDTEAECRCCPPTYVGPFNGAVGLGTCGDISTACGLPPEPPEPPTPTPEPPEPIPACWFEWDGSKWNLRTDITVCSKTCCEPDFSGTFVGEVNLGTCKESCPEPTPTPTCGGRCVYRWIDPSVPGSETPGTWQITSGTDCECICCPPTHIGEEDGEIADGTCIETTPCPPAPDPPSPTPPAPCSSGFCIWTAQPDGSWKLDHSQCHCKCCGPPTFVGFPGDIYEDTCYENDYLCPDDPPSPDPDPDPDPEPGPECLNAGSCAWIFNMDTWDWDLFAGCACRGYTCDPPPPIPIDIEELSDLSADTPCYERE